MLERIRNLIKSDRKKGGHNIPPTNSPKRRKTTLCQEQLVRRYPIKSNEEVAEDEDSIHQHISAIDIEMKKTKPRDSVLLPLYRSTFAVQWKFIKNDAENVRDILKKYVALRHPKIVSIDIPYSSQLMYECETRNDHK